MKSYNWIHRLAIGALCAMAFLNVIAIFRAQQFSLTALASIGGTVAIWILIIWGISVYPKQWGLWIGLFLVGSVFFQIHLRNLVLDRAAMLRLEDEAAMASWRFLASVTLTGAAAVLCLLLRICPAIKPLKPES